MGRQHYFATAGEKTAGGILIGSHCYNVDLLVAPSDFKDACPLWFRFAFSVATAANNAQPKTACMAFVVLLCLSRAVSPAFCVIYKVQSFPALFQNVTCMRFT